MICDCILEKNLRKDHATKEPLNNYYPILMSNILREAVKKVLAVRPLRGGVTAGPLRKENFY